MNKQGNVQNVMGVVSKRIMIKIILCKDKQGFIPCNKKVFADVITHNSWWKIGDHARSYYKILNNWCYYCGKAIKNQTELTLDHVIPKSNGGHGLRHNKVPSCQRCNYGKQSQNLLEFLIQNPFGLPVTEKLKRKWAHEASLISGGVGVYGPEFEKKKSEKKMNFLRGKLLSLMTYKAYKSDTGENIDFKSFTSKVRKSKISLNKIYQDNI